MNQIFEHFGLAAQLAEETSRKNQSDVYVTKSFVGGLRYIATTTPKETDKLLSHYQRGHVVKLGTHPLPKPEVKPFVMPEVIKAEPKKEEIKEVIKEEAPGPKEEVKKEKPKVTPKATPKSEK